MNEELKLIKIFKNFVIKNERKNNLGEKKNRKNNHKKKL